jgi:hypothetical protein
MIEGLNNGSTQTQLPTKVVESESTTPVATTQPPFNGVSAVANSNRDQEEKAEDVPVDRTALIVVEENTIPSVKSDEIPLEDARARVDVEEIKRRTREKLQALNPRGGTRERKVYMSQFARSHC